MAKPETVTLKLTPAEVQTVLLALKWAEYSDEAPTGAADPEKVRLNIIRQIG